MQARSPSGGAIARLRAEAGMLQDRVARELATLAASGSGLDYRQYLCRMYGFLAPVERALTGTAGLAGALAGANEGASEAAIAGLEQRIHKVALLESDLVALGAERSQLGQVSRISAPLLDELPEALGWMYVVEASTLDGDRLARRLALRLASEIDGATAYLRCYGDEVHARWHSFCASLEAYVARAQPGVCDRIVLAATDCLIRLHRWLASAPSVTEARGGCLHA